MPRGNGESFLRSARAGLLCVLLVLAACTPTPADHATRTQVLAYLHRAGAYHPATMRVRAAEWRPEPREWLVDLDERYDPPGSTEPLSLTVNATATAYRDDTCRF